MSSLSHQRAKELLQSALHQELTSFERRILDYHLNQCASCRKYADSLEHYEHTLSNSLQKRWPYRSPRYAEVDHLTQKIQSRAKKTRPFRQILGFSETSLSIIAVIALIMIGSWLSDQMANPADFQETIPPTEMLLNIESAPENDIPPHRLLPMMTIDMNCDGVNENITLAANPEAAYGDYVNVIIQSNFNLENVEWSLDQANYINPVIHQPYLIAMEGSCEKFLVVPIIDPGSWFIILRWEGDHVSYLLNTPGYSSFAPEFNTVTQILEETIFEIRSSGYVNSARCDNVTSEYQWNGVEFIIINTSATYDIGCQNNQ